MYQLPEIPIKRKAKRPAYKKPESVKMLEALADAAVRLKYQNVQAKYLSPRKYRDDTANGLTKCIIDFLRLKGCQAERINCTGRYVDNTTIVEDVIGHRRQIGTAKWLPTSGQKGTADISAVIRSRAVKLEIKVRKDKQRPDQVEYQAQIERAGGLYWLVRSFDEFKQMYDTL